MKNDKKLILGFAWNFCVDCANGWIDFGIWNLEVAHRLLEGCTQTTSPSLENYELRGHSPFQLWTAPRRGLFFLVSGSSCLGAL